MACWMSASSSFSESLNDLPMGRRRRKSGTGTTTPAPRRRDHPNPQPQPLPSAPSHQPLSPSAPRLQSPTQTLESPDPRSHSPEVLLWLRRGRARRAAVGSAARRPGGFKAHAVAPPVAFGTPGCLACTGGRRVRRRLWHADGWGAGPAGLACQGAWVRGGEGGRGRGTGQEG